MLRRCSVPVACLLLVVASGFAQERDKKALRLAAKGTKLAKAAEPVWKAFFDAPGALPAKDLSELIDAYETAIDRLHESLEVEEHAGVNGQILSLARRLAKLRFEEMTREARDRQEAKRAEEERQPAPKPKEKPSPPGELEPPPEEPAPEQPARVARRELVEPADVVRRNTQRLRNFLMHEYFASRKFSKLVLRCARCNGRGKVRSGVLDRRRRPVYVTCGSCDGAGARLKESVARKGFWLVKSPQFRADPGNLAAFVADLDGWRADPGTVPEFLKSLRIVSVDYHGLWATAQCEEKGHVPATERAFRRVVTHKLVRFGRRWFFFDERTDTGVFDRGEE